MKARKRVWQLSDLAAIRESEERFRQLVENIREVFWMSDPARSTILYVSPAYESVWGRSRESLYISPRSWLDAIHLEDRPRVLAAHDEQLGEPSRAYDEEYRVVRPDGSERWIHDRAFPICNEAGEVYRIAGIATDITDRKEAEGVIEERLVLLDVTERKVAEVERRRLEEQLRQSQKMEAIGTLAGGIAHDFNNILGTIIGNVELARLDVDIDHPARESLEEIRRAGRRAKDLVQQILTFSRQEASQRRRIELSPVVDEAIRLLRATLPAGIQLLKTDHEGVPPVLADSSQIHQLILNLCTNAAHAVSADRGRIEVDLNLEQVADAVRTRLPDLAPGLYARLTIRDNGCGMDAATLQHAFEPFFTTKPPGQGTGLGLSVVHGIMKSHQGAVEIQSEPGQGTEVRLYFPASENAGEPVNSPAAPARGSGQRILYLDDEQPLVEMAVNLLGRLGYSVRGFASVQPALDCFRQDPLAFDLVVTDLNMPSSSGLTVAAELMRIRPDLPVVLTSGFITEELKESARLAGIRHVVYKPNTVDELCATIHSMVVVGRQP